MLFFVFREWNKESCDFAAEWEAHRKRSEMCHPLVAYWGEDRPVWSATATPCLRIRLTYKKI